MNSFPHWVASSPPRNYIEIRNEMTDPQSPQASASTNSAIRANGVDTDGVSQETGPQSSAEAVDVSFPDAEISPQNRAHGAGMETERLAAETFGPRITGGPASWRLSGQIGAYRELMVAVDLMSRGHQVFRNLSPKGFV